MKKKLELKHLVGYLPYSLKYKAIWKASFTNQPDIVDIKIMSCENINTLLCKRYALKSAKPILHPLSDLVKDIEVNGEKLVPIEILQKIDLRLNGTLNFDTSNKNEWFYFVDYLKVIQLLCKWHFDIHGLIDEGLAIDINTLNKN